MRHAPLRRRGLFGRRYAVKDVEEFLAFVAIDIESRMHHEEGLLRTIGQLVHARIHAWHVHRLVPTVGT